MEDPVAEPNSRKKNSRKDLFPEKPDEGKGRTETRTPNRNAMVGLKRGSRDRRANGNIHDFANLRSQFQNQRGGASSRAVKETVSHDFTQATPSHLHQGPSGSDIHYTGEKTLSDNSIRKADQDKISYKFVKCRQIPALVSARDLFSAFSLLHNPASVIILRKSAGSSHAFVEFSHSSIAKNTMKKLDGTSIAGRSLSLVLAPQVDRERGSLAENWSAEDQRKWHEKEVARLNKLFEYGTNMFTDYFVTFTNDIETQKGISALEVKDFIERMPSTTTLQLVHLEALSLNIMHYSERIENMKLLIIAWKKDIRLPARRHGMNEERLVNVWNEIEHIIEGPMTTKVPWNETLQSIRDDLDDVHAAQAESDLEWESCFDAYIAERQNPDDDHSGVIEEV
ncbi:hypothetical protein IFR05_012434 [Cadophora sp. M221]|nr:hypothetical protein IFR05_012434 [Cadophora sp. M221]